MGKFNLIKKAMMNPGLAKKALWLRRHIPEICLIFGITTGAAASVATGVQTTKLEPILDDHKKRMDICKEKFKEDEKGLRTATAKEYVKTGGQMAKLYSVPAALEVASICFQIGGHHSLRKENAALATALAGVTAAFKQYREKVKAKGGDLEDIQNLGAETVEVDGQEEKVVVMNTNNLSIYARLFDCGNENWNKDPNLNLMFLKSQMLTANDMLHSRGFIFLNEVYDLLGIPRSEVGQYVGWVDGMGDNFVDFGLYNVMNKNATDCYEQAFWLDFNVDGDIMYIFDKLHGGDGKNLFVHFGDQD